MWIDSFIKKKGQVGEAVDLGLRPRPRPRDGRKPYPMTDQSTCYHFEALLEGLVDFLFLKFRSLKAEHME